MIAPGIINGYKIVIQKDYPKMVLSKDVPVSVEVREFMDKWMVEFFGTVSLMEDGQVFVLDMIRQIHMNQRTYDALPQEFKDMHSKIN